MSAALSKRSQNKKNVSAQGSLKFREVSSSFWEGSWREKTSLKKVSYLLTYLLTHLVSQSEQNVHVVVLCFLQVFKWGMCSYSNQHRTIVARQRTSVVSI